MPGPCTRQLYRRLLCLKPLVAEHDTETAVCLDGTCTGRPAHGARFGTATGVTLPPGCAVSLHTHPAASYEKEGVKVAWPSADDFAALVWASVHGARLHVVLSVEGVYMYRLRPAFRAALDGTKIRVVAAGIKDVLSCSHRARTSRAAIPVFLKWINGFTAESLARPCLGDSSNRTPRENVSGTHRAALDSLVSRLRPGQRWFAVRYLSWPEVTRLARSNNSNVNVTVY